MRRFKFRLARVQSLRRQEADVARRALVAAAAALAHCDERIAAIEQMAIECRTETAAASKAQALAAGMLRGLDGARARALRARAVADQQANIARAAFVQRRAAAEAIDRLHANKHAVWRTAVAKAERDELEELARLSRSVRRLVRPHGSPATSDIEQGERR